jgi:hypothetical protein
LQPDWRVTNLPYSENKTSHEKYPWLVLNNEQTSLGDDASEYKESGCTLLNKNATDMGTSVAGKLNQKIWLNCCAETRPWRYRKQ